jgi:1,4-dihydroxy-2-naphthoate octaprenyltransferase
MNKLYIHLWVLPRPFALPAIGCGVALGCLQTGSSGLLIALAILCAGTVTAWAHAMNTLLDYGLGIDTPNSRPKSYNKGNQVIVRGWMAPEEVCINALCWLGVSFILAVAIAANSTWWIFLPWGLSALITFPYSLAKLHYLSEVTLGLGASLAVMIGAASSGSFTFGQFGPAFMSSLAFAWVFGFGAEFIDQAFDAGGEPRSRNMGALARRIGVHPVTFTCLLLSLAYIIQIALVIGGFLAPLTLSTLTLMPLFVYLIMAVQRDPFDSGPDPDRGLELRPAVKVRLEAARTVKVGPPLTPEQMRRKLGLPPGGEPEFNSKAIMAAMVVMFLWMLTVVICQAVAR